MIALSSDVAAMRQKHKRLQLILGLYPRWLIAYSGGVDSTYLLAEATSLLGRSALGVIADSPSLPRKALSSAIAVAQNLGAQLRVIRTGELAKPEYAANPLNRCYFCKHELFDQMQRLALDERFPVLAYGENADDAMELRPGAEAATEFKVKSPLREAGLTKAEIRWLSRERNLPTADQPAQPCLSSRIPHGTPVTREALLMVENAEDRLRAEGFRVFRVRYYIAKDGAITAKLQVDPSELGRLYPLRTRLERDLRVMGFSRMMIDPIGYQPPKRAGKVISDQSSVIGNG
jgi:pyridinium-3,5-biscarboxylic acid mononucleotide sulfurtransferase